MGIAGEITAEHDATMAVAYRIVEIDHFNVRIAKAARLLMETGILQTGIPTITNTGIAEFLPEPPDLSIQEMADAEHEALYEVKGGWLAHAVELVTSETLFDDAANGPIRRRVVTVFNETQKVRLHHSNRPWKRDERFDRADIYSTGFGFLADRLKLPSGTPRELVAHYEAGYAATAGELRINTHHRRTARAMKLLRKAPALVRAIDIPADILDEPLVLPVRDADSEDKYKENISDGGVILTQYGVLLPTVSNQRTGRSLVRTADSLVSRVRVGAARFPTSKELQRIRQHTVDYMTTQAQQNRFNDF